MFQYPLDLVRRSLRSGAATLALLALTGLLAVIAAPAGAQSTSTPGLAEARQRADAAAAEINRLSSELGVLDEDIRRAEAEAAAAQAELEALRGQVRDLAVRRYTQVGDRAQDIGGDINERERAKVLLATVTGESTDAIDRYRATRAQVDASLADLADRQGEQAAALDDLQSQRARLDAELDRLEDLERQRVAEEQRRRQEEAQRAAEAEARQAAAEQAALLAGQQEAAATGKELTSGAATSTTAPPSSTAGGSGATTTTSPPSTGGGGPTQIASGSWVCPVQGARSFVDSWGYPRPGGRAHQGVDIMSPRGTPVVLPVAGSVSFKSGGIGGLTFRLNGNDGNWYYGAHLDAYAGLSPGSYPAGTVVGYVGDTGDARGTGTHLHFEIHIGGYGNAVNPYPTTAAHC